MAESLKLLDVVALTADMPAKGLRKGQVGTVVGILSTDTYEVEFCDNDGKTYALASLRSAQLLALIYHPAHVA